MKESEIIIISAGGGLLMLLAIILFLMSRCRAKRAGAIATKPITPPSFTPSP